MINYYNFFSGIGAFEYSINKLKLGWKCNGYSEINKQAIKTYDKHYPSHTNYGDITKIRGKELKDSSVFLISMPCQSFSIAGKKKGLDDKRGNLFYDVIRLLKDKQPSYFIFENVRGILTNNGGKTFNIIKKELDEVGYNIKWNILNTKDYKLAQNRSRIFIFGERKDLGPFDFEFIEKKNNKVNLIDILEKNIDEKYKVSKEQIINWYNSSYHSNKSQFLNKHCCCLTVGGNQKRVITNKSDDFIKRYYNKELGYSELLNIEGKKLKPEEYELLQGLNVGYTDVDISNTARYSLLSNSIGINVLDEILTQFNLYIEENKKQF